MGAVWLAREADSGTTPGPAQCSLRRRSDLAYQRFDEVQAHVAHPERSHQNPRPVYKFLRAPT